jgi:3-dehydrosphinganine reductase
VANLFAQLAADGAMPAILINSAGTTHPGRFIDLEEAHFRTSMAVNYWGTVHTLQHAVPWMIDRGEGQILNVSSVAGILGVYGMTAYSAAKFAVRGLSASLRAELKEHGINVSVLCPPDTDTPMLREEVLQRPPETEALSPSDQAISAEAVAQVTIREWSRGRATILPGKTAVVPALIARLSPTLLEWFMDRTVRHVQGARGSHAPT